MTRFHLRGLALAAGAVLLASCADGTRSTLAPDDALRASNESATLIECSADSTRSVTATIGALGGSIELGAHRMSLPLNAVTVPTEFTLTVPASKYMEVDIRANGQEHHQFNTPVELTVDYSRCTRSNIDLEKTSLKIFYIDSGTKAILEDMGGVDDKATRTVTTSTDHLSGYAIGEN